MNPTRKRRMIFIIAYAALIIFFCYFYTSVTFQPVDPVANDTFAADPADVKLAWTLGHVIVHATASSEESAFLAAEMARGVANHGRSRSETAWETVTTISSSAIRSSTVSSSTSWTISVRRSSPYFSRIS